jgi:hypothetical protein
LQTSKSFWVMIRCARQVVTWVLPGAPKLTSDQTNKEYIILVLFKLHNRDSCGSSSRKHV